MTSSLTLDFFCNEKWVSLTKYGHEVGKYDSIETLLDIPNNYNEEQQKGGIW